MSSMNHYRKHRKTPQPAQPPLTCWGFLDRLFSSPHRFRRLMLLVTLTTTPPDTLTALLPTTIHQPTSTFG